MFGFKKKVTNTTDTNGYTINMTTGTLTTIGSGGTPLKTDVDFKLILATEAKRLTDEAIMQQKATHIKSVMRAITDSIKLGYTQTSVQVHLLDNGVDKFFMEMGYTLGAIPQHIPNMLNAYPPYRTIHWTGDLPVPEKETGPIDPVSP